MDENGISKIVVDAAYKVHVNLGPGLLESVYEVVLDHELKKAGLETERQKPIEIKYDGITFSEGFRADIIVNEKVILELKSIEKVDKIHKKQLLTYLRLTDMRLGILINFGSTLIKNGIHRVVNNLIE
jgi:GxxExxY protein